MKKSSLSLITNIKIVFQGDALFSHYITVSYCNLHKPLNVRYPVLNSLNWWEDDAFKYGHRLLLSD